VPGWWIRCLPLDEMDADNEPTEDEHEHHPSTYSLFVGNPLGGRTAAILTSTSRRHEIDQIDPQLYLIQPHRITGESSFLATRDLDA